MDVKEMNVVNQAIITTTVTTTTIITTVTKPTTIITQIASKENLKILELTEYCRMAQFTIKECETKIQMLVSAKNETAKLKMEYLTRDKINITNSESLIQAKNELFQYKCELKSKYIAIEKEAKTKKLKYEKLISCYDTAWQKALEEYSSNPLVKELYEIQQTNAVIEKNIEVQEKLNLTTKIQMSEFHRNTKEKFINKILEFSKAMLHYRKFLDSQIVHRKTIETTIEKNLSLISRGKNKTEDSRNPHGNGHMKLSKSSVPAFSKTISFNQDDASYFPGVDVSVFDELMVPTENLETQNEEDEFFHFIHNQNIQIGNSEQEERPEMFLNDQYQSQAQDKNKMQFNSEDGKKQNIGNAAKEGDESQYFRTQAPDNLRHLTVQNTTVENWDHVDNLNEYGNIKFKDNSLPSTGILNGNERANREVNTDLIDKSLKEATYDNQNDHARENFEYIYNKTNSVSFEEMSLSAENINESFGSPRKNMNIEHHQVQDDQDKEESKSFEDFFTMSGRNSSSNPSIFKLF